MAGRRRRTSTPPTPAHVSCEHRIGSSRVTTVGPVHQSSRSRTPLRNDQDRVCSRSTQLPRVRRPILQRDARREAFKMVMSCATRLLPAGARGYRSRTSIKTGVARCRACSMSLIPTSGSSPAFNSATRATHAAARRMWPTWVAFAPSSVVRPATGCAPPTGVPEERHRHRVSQTRPGNQLPPNRFASSCP